MNTGLRYFWQSIPNIQRNCHVLPMQQSRHIGSPSSIRLHYLSYCYCYCLYTNPLTTLNLPYLYLPLYCADLVFIFLDIYCFRFPQLCQIPFKSLFTFVVLRFSGDQISLIFVKHIKLWIRSLYKFISINRITQANSSVLPKLEATLTIDLQGYLSRWCYLTIID